MRFFISGGFDDGDQTGERRPLGMARTCREGDLPRAISDLLAHAFDLIQDTVNIAVPGGGAKVVVFEQIEHVGHMAGPRANVKDRRADVQDVVDLARMIVALDAANRVLGRVYVLGQVRSQGAVELTVNENLTVGTAILRAGGLGDFANKKRVKLIRGGGSDGAAKQIIELNMVEILEQGKVEKDVVLQPNDFIIVPSRMINF
jgi:hypothetical protein